MGTSRLWLLGLTALAVASALLTLFTGPTLDDMMHPFVLEERGPWGLYDFLGSSDVPDYRSVGRLPWWTSPSLSMRFFRPLSSLDLAIDHLYLDGGGLLSHIHSLLWFLLLLALVHKLFVALVGPQAARFATPLYALASWHTMSLAFVAARHTVVTAVFAAASFLLFVRFVETGRRTALGLSAGFYSLGLLAGESALLVVPLLAGWTYARRGFKEALSAIAPVGLLTIIYLLFYVFNHFGAKGSSLYLEPTTTLFWLELPARWLSLAGDLLGSLAMDVTLLGGRAIQLFWGVVSLAASALALEWFRTKDPGRARELTGLACGGLVAFVPASAAMPGGRSLVIIGIASSALFGSLLSWSLREGSSSGGARWISVWVLLFGVGLHPLFRVVMAWDLRRQGRDMQQVAQRIEESCAGRLVLGAGTLDMSISFVPYVLGARGGDQPLSVHVLSMALGEHQLQRPSKGRYELAIEGEFFESLWSRNHSTEPLHRGMRVELDHLTVEVLRVDPRVVLDLRLEPESSPCWVTSGPSGLRFLPPVEELSTWTPTKIR